MPAKVDLMIKHVNLHSQGIRPPEGGLYYFI